ncbi:hypothetical protein C8Q78DRAFT_1145171 [Trametes maxima]|nr:hypothetical protein C8Q78DRAFT_1145171 [Trametes maxima]
MSGTIASVAAQYLNRAYWKASSSPQPLPMGFSATRYRQDDSQRSLSVKAPHLSRDRSTDSAGQLGFAGAGPPPSDSASGHSSLGEEKSTLHSPSKSRSTLAERRGKKGLVLQGFMRSPTPDSSSSPEQEYPSDPFARNRDVRPSSFYDDPHSSDAAPVRPHPDLYDLSVYAAPPPRATTNSNSIPKKAAKDWRARAWLYVGVLVPDLAPASDPPVSHPPPQPPLHSTPRAPGLSPTLDREDAPPPSPAPISAPLARSPRVYSPAATLSAHRLSTTIHSGPFANLRPLLLPQKFACREIAEAQATPISPRSTPNLRPLLLPQELARRASHPQYRARPRPATLPPGFGRLAYKRTFSASMSNNTSVVNDMTSGTLTGAGDTKAEQKERRKSQQLDDIISLLDESGVLCETGEQVATTGALTDSEESTGIMTPPSLLSRPGTSSPFSLIGQPHEDSVNEAIGESRRESRNLEDILKLLDGHRDEAIAKEDNDCLTDDGFADTSVCAYAM